MITGDEILRGRLNDRNLAVVARLLEPRGVRVTAGRLVRDRRDEITAAVGGALAEGVDVVVVTGGLGPTHDDLSMEAVAQAAGRDLWVDPDALAMVSARDERVSASEAARRAAAVKQSTLPRGAVPLPPIGTAPGAVLWVDDAALVVLPGPPWELEAMLKAALSDGPLAELGSPSEPPAVARVAGVSESRFAEVIERADAGLRRSLEIGVCARDGELEVTVRGDRLRADDLLDHLAEDFGASLYSRDGSTLDDRVAEGLRGRGESLAVAESCTGGGLGARLTSRPGSSDYFVGGVIAYDNRAKETLLEVSGALIAKHGAVSGRCVEAMARGARSALGADWALGVTGIAGPAAGGPGKPVGLVYLGCARPDASVAIRELRLRGSRERIRGRSVAAALHLLREELDEA